MQLNTVKTKKMILGSLAQASYTRESQSPLVKIDVYR